LIGQVAIRGHLVGRVLAGQRRGHLDAVVDLVAGCRPRGDVDRRVAVLGRLDQAAQDDRVLPLLDGDVQVRAPLQLGADALGDGGVWHCAPSVEYPERCNAGATPGTHLAWPSSTAGSAI